MKRTQLPKELIEDYQNDVAIIDLCRKYDLNRNTISNQLIKIGVREKKTWGGRRKGCGRKRRERGTEIRKIREKNAKMRFAKQPEGTKVNPRFNECRKYNNTFYEGGF